MVSGCAVAAPNTVVVFIKERDNTATHSDHTLYGAVAGCGLHRIALAGWLVGLYILQERASEE